MRRNKFPTRESKKVAAAHAIIIDGQMEDIACAIVEAWTYFHSGINPLVFVQQEISQFQGQISQLVMDLV